MIFTTPGVNDAKTQPYTSQPGISTGGPVILVVEDDWSTRGFICTVLKRATSAVVIQASGPDEALAIARSSSQPVDLLISEINLSARMTGVDLAREMAVQYPATNILLMSADDCPPRDIPSAWRFLAKPFPLAVFLDCVSYLSASARTSKPRAERVKAQSAA